MAESIQGIKVSALPEATQEQLTDASVTIVDDGTTTRKTKLLTFVEWLKGKIIKNTLTQASTGYALDAYQGKLLKDKVDELNSAMKRESFSILPTTSEVSTKVKFSSKFNRVPTVVVTPTFQGWRLSKPIQVSDITTNGFTATAWIENSAISSDIWMTFEYMAIVLGT